MAGYTLSVNGVEQTVESEPAMPLLWVLRDLLELTGTKYGCGIGQCGSCTVMLDGVATRTCQTPVSTVGSANILTIEGLTEDGDHPLQIFWDELNVSQCGFCQAGQIMNAAALLRDNPNPTDEDIDRLQSGNLCRCGTYVRIREAIKRASIFVEG
jgi:isoquinoline 1-oxidoreductase subunit alpha